MNILKSVSIKNFLSVVVWLLVVMLVIQSALDIKRLVYNNDELKRILAVDELSNGILVASGFEAKERGVTSMALSSSSAVDSGVRQKMQDMRDKGDDAYKKALTAGGVLSGMGAMGSLQREALQRSQKMHADLEAARRAIDLELGNAVKNYSPQVWIRLITSVIDSKAELRLAARELANGSAVQDSLRANMDMKDAIWHVSEYAGRERAAMAYYVTSRKPIDEAGMAKLNTFRAVVEKNLLRIMQLKASKDTGADVLSAISRMEAIYLGSFSEVRRSVYDSAQTGAYPITGKEWIEKSTEAIDTILAVDVASAKMMDGKVETGVASSRRDMAITVGAFGVIIGIGLFALLVIKRKVTAPMRHLTEAIAEVEKSGDLTVKLNITSKDETGMIASSFNRMMDKFHDIIKEIHAGAEHLASSSEELSATAAQIAAGTQTQASRATQVSTSSNEMSSTIIEVTKNIGGAAQAAKEAGDVAVTGGVQVQKTINSMKDISGTAREASRIISALGGRSSEIGGIIGVINDIADQTNLLALNAAIEAARAGDQGRGFAVVADEVRKLAEKTMQATKEIGAMIKAMQDETKRAIASVDGEVKAVEGGVKLAEDAGGALKAIVGKVDVVTSMIHQITSAMEEQSAVTEQICGDVEAVANVATETTTSAKQIARASEELAQLAAGLKSNVDMFKVMKTIGAAAGTALPMARKRVLSAV
ncbi:MAG: methyl-accepting chemotaxis protein [Deltaproteobacteria bacterium]|nr:methyl-accepting chemotaxis protein [Deltaproteobacteria bacterium]